MINAYWSLTKKLLTNESTQFFFFVNVDKKTFFGRIILFVHKYVCVSVCVQILTKLRYSPEVVGNRLWTSSLYSLNTKKKKYNVSHLGLGNRLRTTEPSTSNYLSDPRLPYTPRALSFVRARECRAALGRGPNGPNGPRPRLPAIVSNHDNLYRFSTCRALSSVFQCFWQRVKYLYAAVIYRRFRVFVECNYYRSPWTITAVVVVL